VKHQVNGNSSTFESIDACYKSKYSSSGRSYIFFFVIYFHLALKYGEQTKMNLGELTFAEENVMEREIML
jgi:hypothetical protein